jgi:hypothetical protein
MKRRMASVAIALGALLMLLNVAGMWAPIAEHPVALRKPVHKSGLVRLSYQETLDALDRLGNLPPERLITEANRIIAARIVHRWPDPGESDPHTMHSFLENWYLAILQRGEAWLAGLGLMDIDIARVGRREYRPILAKGVGLCGMASTALVDFLQERNIRAKILALGGHVVAYVSADGRNYILDPDYGVTIADVPAPPDRSLPKISAAYRQAGYELGSVQKLEAIYAAARMRLYELPKFQRRYKRFLLSGAIIKWTVPLLLIGFGALGWLIARPQPPALPQGAAATPGRAD